MFLLSGMSVVPGSVWDNVNVDLYAISSYLNAGGKSIRDFRVLSNRQQVLTKDSDGDVALWDVLHVRETLDFKQRIRLDHFGVCVCVVQAVKEEDLGKVDIDEEADSRKGKLYIPNWFSVEVKTGVSVQIALHIVACGGSGQQW